MIDTTQYTKTHELYTQFGQWLGVDGKVDSNYFMINYSLHAAESYIKNYYNIDLSLGTVFEKVNKNSAFSPSNHPTKIITVFKDNKLSYPTITYLDAASFDIVTSQGDYTTDMNLQNSPVDFYSEYLIGYIYTDTSDYSDIDFDDEYRLPSPRLYLGNSQSVKSPQTILSSSLEVKVVGTPNSKVIVNSVEVGVVSPEGTYTYTSTLTQEVTTISFKLRDAIDDTKESVEVRELFVLSSKVEAPYVHLLGYTKKVNTKEGKVRLLTPIGSTLTVNNVPTVTTSLITEISVPFATDLTSYDLKITITSTLNGKTSKPIYAKVGFSSSFSDAYLNELNKDYSYTPYLPDDLLVATFKLANHLYNGTLYNNSNVESFRTANDISQTYTSHSIPSDIKNLLGSYTHYRP